MLQETLEIDALWPLNRQSQSSIPDQLRQGAQATGDAKRGSIVERLVEAVVVKEHARRRIDVGVGVLGLAVLLEHFRSDAAVLLDELEDGVFCNLRTGGGVVHESFEAGIRFAQNGVTVAGDDAAGFEGAPEIVVDVLLCVAGRNRLFHLYDPAEDFLGSKAVLCQQMSRQS